MMSEECDCLSWDKAINDELCKEIINLGEGNWDIGTTSKYKLHNPDRKNDIVWIHEQWIYDLIWNFMMSANEQAGWKYKIVAAERCQLTRYSKDGFYNWHRDGLGSHNAIYDEPDDELIHGNTRKISMSIVLNSDFEGGEFEIDGNDDVPILKEGSVIVFPSVLRHRVTPVTKGTRYSLVAWFIGPPFV